jgi:predicted HNH restriction endonuclease
MVEQLTVNASFIDNYCMKEKRTYADRREYIKMAVAKRRKKIREMAIEYKGGKCDICGYSKCHDALDFHHLDSNQKDFGLSQAGLTRSWLRTKNELDKCIMLCANCHRELHNNQRSLPK